jgi:ubiquitin carboxyl-terminal hydrolase 25/28
MFLVIQTEEQALKWLDSTYDGSVPLSDHGIIAMAASKIADRPDQVDVCAVAIKVIADARNSADLRAWLCRGDAPYDSVENDIAAAYSFFGLYDRTETPNPEVLKLSLGFIVQDSPHRREEAHRHYDVIMKHLAQPQVNMADYDNPVGLSNMGNTCYLNCLLQYFYAIRPLRDIVLNFDDYKIDTDAEPYEEKYVEKEKISRAQTVKSQLCKHPLVQQRSS